MSELHEYAALGDDENVQELLFKGVNVNEKDFEWEGKTALHWSATNGHYYTSQLLINAGASVNSRMNNGWTPLHCAVEGCHIRIVELLLDHGANPLSNDRYGVTPSSLSLVYRKEPIVKLLEKYKTKNEDKYKRKAFDDEDEHTDSQ